MIKMMSFLAGAALAIGFHVQDKPDLDALVEEVQKELGDDYTVKKHLDLFVVASNDPEALKRGMGTVEHVFKAMHKDFMKTRPDKPLKVFLFKDKASYDAYNKKAYHREPTTPYGFYMPSERKMVMNIATGLGTLAHEMVHPLNEADFPSIPSWFNEGFASLYEQSYYLRDGSIRGDVNWRLPGLQKAMRNENHPRLKSVMETSTSEFYGMNSGLNYAAARYLCHYLQEQGKLVEFYQSFRDGAKDDPSGVQTLEKVLGKKLDEFQPEYEKFVLELNYR